MWLQDQKLHIKLVYKECSKNTRGRYNFPTVLKHSIIFGSGILGTSLIADLGLLETVKSPLGSGIFSICSISMST